MMGNNIDHSAKVVQKQIIDIIAPIRKRVYGERIINTVIVCMFITSFLLLGLSIAVHIIAIPFVMRWILGTIGIFLGVGIIIGMCRYPKTSTIIRVTDGLGLKERLMTAWELSNEQSSESVLQRKETFHFVREKNLKKVYKQAFRKRELVISGAVMVIAFIILTLPSPLKEEAKTIENFHKEVVNEVEKLENEKEKLYKELAIDKKQQQEIDQKLDALMKKLKKARTEEEALKELSMAKNEMKKLDPDRMKEEVKHLEKVMKNPHLKEIQRAMQNEDSDMMKKQLEELLKALEEENKNNEHGKEIAKELEEAKESISNERVKKALEELAENVANNNQQGAQLAAENLQKVLEESYKNSENIKQLSTAMQNAVNSAGQSLSSEETISQMALGGSQQSQSGTAGVASNNMPTSTSQTSGASHQGGQNLGSGDSQGIISNNPNGSESAEGSNQSSSQGSSNGQQGGGAGQGAGVGSTNEDAGYANDNGIISSGGNGQGEKKGTYEALYQPDRLGGRSDPTFVKGTASESGMQTSQQVNTVPIDNGELVNYQELLGEYEDIATKNISSMDVPPIMKDVVLEYFTNLE